MKITVKEENWMKKKMKSILHFKSASSSKDIKSIFRATQKFKKTYPNSRSELTEKTTFNEGNGLEKDEFNETRKTIGNILCVVEFYRDRDKPVTTNASLTGLRRTL